MTDPNLLREKTAVDIITGSMYSLNFLRNITEAIFNPQLESLSVGEFYEQWLKTCNYPEHDVPYNFGSIVGYLYCGILLAKEHWFDLLPDERIDIANPGWGFSSATYSSSSGRVPTIKHVMRRIRNSLGHGNILFNVPTDLRKEKLEFEKRVTVEFHDVNPREVTDTFDIEISLLELTKAIKKFQTIAYKHVIAKI